MSTPEQDAQAFWDAAAPATFTTYAPGVGESPGTPISRMMPNWSQLQAKVGELIQSVKQLYGVNAQVTAVTARVLNPKADQVLVYCRPAPVG